MIHDWSRREPERYDSDAVQSEQDDTMYDAEEERKQICDRAGV